MKAAMEFCFYKVFGSHMVLQRQRPIVFSGTADARSCNFYRMYIHVLLPGQQ